MIKYYYLFLFNVMNRFNKKHISTYYRKNEDVLCSIKIIKVTKKKNQ